MPAEINRKSFFPVLNLCYFGGTGVSLEPLGLFPELLTGHMLLSLFCLPNDGVMATDEVWYYTLTCTVWSLRQPHELDVTHSLMRNLWLSFLAQGHMAPRAVQEPEVLAVLISKPPCRHLAEATLPVAPTVPWSPPACWAALLASPSLPVMQSACLSCLYLPLSLWPIFTVFREWALGVTQPPSMKCLFCVPRTRGGAPPKVSVD